jgi:hypothetical protein
VHEGIAHESVHEGISQKQLVIEAHAKGGQDRLAWDHSSRSTVVAIEGASRKVMTDAGRLQHCNALSVILGCHQGSCKGQQHKVPFTASKTRH